MREDALPCVRMTQPIPKRGDGGVIAPMESGPAHPGVHLDLEGPTRTCQPGVERGDVADDGGEAMLDDGIEIRRVSLQGREHHHGSGNPGLAELGAFLGGRDSIAPRVECLECAGYGNCPESIGVRLDHGEQRGTRKLDVPARIAEQRIEVDVEPGPVGSLGN